MNTRFAYHNNTRNAVNNLVAGITVAIIVTIFAGAALDIQGLGMSLFWIIAGAMYPTFSKASQAVAWIIATWLLALLYAGYQDPLSQSFALVFFSGAAAIGGSLIGYGIRELN